MILCDSEIRAAIQHGQIVIDPDPPREHYSPTALDLCLGEREFKRWKPPGPGVDLVIDPAQAGFFRSSTQFLEDVPPAPDGSVTLGPGEFLLALTRERVELPVESRLAARVEGKSSLARVGLSVHLTAPVIHGGFRGRITLELKNQGHFPIKLSPGIRICQLVFENVFGTPSITLGGLFQNQESVTGRAP